MSKKQKAAIADKENLETGRAKIKGQHLSKTTKRMMANFGDAQVRNTYKYIMLDAERSHELNKRRKQVDKTEGEGGETV